MRGRARTRARFAAALLGAALLVSACGEAAPPPAPVEPRAGWLLEPPRVRLGEVASLERLVVTPPGWTVSPLVPPQAVEGFWLLDAEALAPERLASRWVHRTRLRIRAREIGSFEWPAARAQAQAPDGSAHELELEPLTLEVVSVLPESPDRLTPFGIRPLPGAAPGIGSLLAAAAAGALVTTAALAVLLLVVRRRRARAPAPLAPPAGEPPDARARAALADARRLLAGDPRGAADRTSAALRQFLAARFGVPAPARTSEELAAAAPPFALSTRWPSLLALLRALDAERFAPPRPAPESAARVAPLVDEALAIVDQSALPASPR
jgi:hypothetical protein